MSFLACIVEIISEKEGRKDWEVSCTYCTLSIVRVLCVNF